MDQLARNVKDWTNKAINESFAGDSINTLFQLRKDHFAQEKLFIAEHFFPMLLNRCEELVRQYDEVYLLIDSGTTVFPFFEKIGKAARANPVSLWVQQLKFITNNIPGVTALMRVGRQSENNPYSPLTLNCKLMPGDLLPVYEAVVGPEAEKMLNCLRQSEKGPQKSRKYIISLVTGNWVRTDINHSPILLARGTGHKEIKQAFITNSDEVYIITPLGKILFQVPLSQVNASLGYDKKAKGRNFDPAKEEYSEVVVNSKCKKNMRFVSTLRPDENYLLSNLSKYIKSQLKLKATPSPEDFASMDIKNIPHIFFPFSDLPASEEEQRLMEFPHDVTRRTQFMRFYLNPEKNPKLPES
jgi:hypothetical protein